MVTTAPHLTSGSGLRKFQADRFLFDRIYNTSTPCNGFVPDKIAVTRLNEKFSNIHEVLKVF